MCVRRDKDPRCDGERVMDGIPAKSFASLISELKEQMAAKPGVIREKRDSSLNKTTVMRFSLEKWPAFSAPS